MLENPENPEFREHVGTLLNPDDKGKLAALLPLAYWACMLENREFREHVGTLLKPDDKMNDEGNLATLLRDADIKVDCNFNSDIFTQLCPLVDHVNQVEDRDKQEEAQKARTRRAEGLRDLAIDAAKRRLSEFGFTTTPDTRVWPMS